MDNKDFINKEFEQNCGDRLLVIEKSNILSNRTYLWRCQFQKYPCEILAKKNNIIKGCVDNPQIEKVEFIDKFWPQNCGDVLKIIKKSDKKGKNRHYLWEVEFLKYPYRILAYKENIVKGRVDNPQIEQCSFVGKVYKQKNGEVLKVIEKTNQQIKEKSNFLFRCQFLGDYSSFVLARKAEILNGEVDNPALPWKSKENLERYLKENFPSTKPTLFELSEKINISISHLSNLLCEYDLQNYIYYYPDFLESEIKDYILNLGIDVKSVNFSNKEIANFQNTYEIDCYNEKNKIGIEINGSYWHSELYRDKNYHQNKTLAAKNQGIKLFHIFEFEWKDKSKQNILKYFLKSKFNLFETKIYARQCDIKEIDSITYRDFCNNNHIQGYAFGSKRYGLFYKDELVQVMSFDIPRFTDKYQYEMIRECSKLGYLIIGGKNKLWNRFLQDYQPESVISYCDFAKFTGESYLKLGFRLERLNTPGFVWFDLNTGAYFWRSPQNNQEYQKRYLKIYDAGQLVFVWKGKE